MADFTIANYFEFIFVSR